MWDPSHTLCSLHVPLQHTAPSTRILFLGIWQLFTVPVACSDVNWTVILLLALVEAGSWLSCASSPLAERYPRTHQLFLSCQLSI